MQSSNVKSKVTARQMPTIIPQEAVSPMDMESGSAQPKPAHSVVNACSSALGGSEKNGFFIFE